MRSYHRKGHLSRILHWVPIPMSMPTHAHRFWVGMGAILLFMGGHGVGMDGILLFMSRHVCFIIGNIIGNITIFEYMGAI